MSQKPVHRQKDQKKKVPQETTFLVIFCLVRLPVVVIRSREDVASWDMQFCSTARVIKVLSLLCVMY